VAAEVIYTALLIGPIDLIQAIDPYDTVLSILDQSVIVNGSTVFKGVTLNGLAAGNLVEISGFLDGAGQIQGAFVRKLADVAATSGDTYSVTGQVGNLDPIDQAFSINTLAIAV
jgi:hypothetical protein